MRVSQLKALRYSELIDTCWDVNNDMRASAGSEYSELIDTCWDVNYVGRVPSVLMDSN